MTSERLFNSFIPPKQISGYAPVPRPFQQSLSCFPVARSPSNSWASWLIYGQNWDIKCNVISYLLTVTSKRTHREQTSIRPPYWIILDIHPKLDTKRIITNRKNNAADSGTDWFDSNPNASSASWHTSVGLSTCFLRQVTRKVCWMVGWLVRSLWFLEKYKSDFHEIYQR